jgi:alpha-1,3-glucan synthase
MSSAQAWQDHGCYKLNSTQYFNFGDILNLGKTGCQDDWNSLDHRDPTAEPRRYLQTMYYMRENYPSLNDGFILEKLSNHTTPIYLVGSNNTPTETGLWSVARSPLAQTQDFSNLTSAGNLTVWLLYTNVNESVGYTFDCSNKDTALLSPYFGGETVKNLFWPYEEYTLSTSSKEFYANGSAPYYGCLSSISMKAYSYKAFVPKKNWIEMYPVVTSFTPGHDARILSENGPATIPIEFKFSQNMSCDAVTKGLTIKSTTETGTVASINMGSINCADISPPEDPTYVGALGSSWIWQATLENIHDGVHQLTLTNITNSAGTDSTRVNLSPDKLTQKGY